MVVQERHLASHGFTHTAMRSYVRGTKQPVKETSYPYITRDRRAVDGAILHLSPSVRFIGRTNSAWLMNDLALR